jgi:hypothetical protein
MPAMAAMTSTCRAVFLAALFLCTHCSKEPAPAASEPPVARTPGGPAPVEQLPIPEAVAQLHRNVFQPAATEAKLGEAVCLITLHDAALERGDFHPLVLFAGGSVTTWTQKPRRAEQPHHAKLSADELVRASALIERIPAERAKARERFEAGTLVMGVTTRVGDRVETLYFDNATIPPGLSSLVSVLKHRLEIR